MTGLQVAEGRTAVPLSRAAADINEKNRAAYQAIDSLPASGWGATADDEAGRPHFLVVQAKETPRAPPREPSRARAP